jgi:hypothetical protein
MKSDPTIAPTTLARQAMLPPPDPSALAEREARARIIRDASSVNTAR